MIDIAELARQAAVLGVPVARRQTLTDGQHVDFEVSDQGAVTVLTPCWEPVYDIRNGQAAGIADFRPVPVDPLTQMQEGFVQFHVLFTNLRGGGFTIDEAAAVIAAIIRGAQANPPQQEGP